ncbi:MAG: GNAT family N-acetyltransferase [Prevotella sp.]|nr:GNAT family N-acetyltransferase [Prevotella sp.]
MKDIRFRAIEPEDLDLLYRIENDVETWNVGTSNVPYSRYLLHDYVANSKNDIYADRQVRMMVEDTEGNVVGVVDLVNFDPSNCRAELGLIILSSYRHQGYGTVVLERISDYAQRILHLHQIYVYVDCRNEVSLRLFKKAGFCVGAEIKDWLYDGRNYRDSMLLQRVF